MFRNIWAFLDGLGSSKRTREEESYRKTKPEAIPPNRAALHELREEHIRQKYNSRPSSVTESDFHSSREKLTPETIRPTRTALLREEHIRQKFNPRPSSATESGFPRSRQKILEGHSASRSSPYNVNIDSTKSDEKAKTINSTQIQPTTELYEDKSDVINWPTRGPTSPTLMPEKRISDTALITSSQLKDSSVIHQDEKSISRKEQTDVCKRYENGDKIPNCKSSKHSIDYFNEKYKLYDYSNDSKSSAELESYYQSQTVINNSLVEPPGQKHQDRNNEIHSENFTGDDARVPSPLHEDKGNENYKTAIPCMTYKQEMIKSMSYKEIRERVHNGMPRAILYSSSVPIPHKNNVYLHHQTETMDTNEKITRGGTNEDT